MASKLREIETALFYRTARDGRVIVCARRSGLARRDFEAARKYLGGPNDFEVLLWMKPVRLRRVQIEAMILTLDSVMVAQHVKWSVAKFHELTSLACKLPHTKVLEDTAVSTLFRWITGKTIMYSRV